MTANKREKIVICLSDKPELIKPLYRLAGSEIFKNKEVHLINVFAQEIYAYEFSPYVWPDEKLFLELKTSVEQGMKKTADELFPNAADRAHVEVHCFLHHSPKQKITEYLKEIDASMVVVATRGTHGLKGLFTSSTAEHLMKFSPCDVYVLRTTEE